MLPYVSPAPLIAAVFVIAACAPATRVVTVIVERTVEAKPESGQMASRGNAALSATLTPEGTPTARHAATTTSERREGYVTLGSSKAKVLALLGEPRRTSTFSVGSEFLDSESWYYTAGLQPDVIEFNARTGTVIGWDNYSGRLPARLQAGTRVTADTAFTLGSHQDDVLRIQGPPRRVHTFDVGIELLKSVRLYYPGTDLLWEDTVEIDWQAQLVKGWTNSSGRLRAALDPSASRSSSNDARFSVGSSLSDILKIQGEPYRVVLFEVGIETVAEIWLYYKTANALEEARVRVSKSNSSVVGYDNFGGVLKVTASLP